MTEEPSTTGGSSISGMESRATSVLAGSSEWGGTDVRGIEDLDSGTEVRVIEPRVADALRADEC